MSIKHSSAWLTQKLEDTMHSPGDGLLSITDPKLEITVGVVGR